MAPEIGKNFTDPSPEEKNLELNEVEKTNLLQLDRELDELERSMRDGNGTDTIYYFLNQIRSQLKKEVPNDALLEGNKLELIGAYTPHYDSLTNLVANSLPKSLPKNVSASLKALPNGMLDSIGKFLAQDLISDREKGQRNKFDLGEWREKVQKIHSEVKKLL